MADEPLPALHGLMERLGDQSTVLDELGNIAADIERRYYIFTRRIGVAAIIVVIALITALAFERSIVSELHQESNNARRAAKKADQATLQLQRTVRTNRNLIVQNCQDLERLKRPIRQVLKEGAPQYLPLFKPQPCP